MKTKAPDSFEKKLSSYSLAAGAVLLAAGSAQAQDVWRSAEMTQVLNDRDELTITFDGNAKFKIQNNLQSGSISNLTANAGWRFDVSNMPFAYKLYGGGSVNPGTGAWDTNDYIFKPMFPNNQNFGGGNAIYIGVFFNTTRPGWIKLNVPDQPRSNFTVKGYAYERTAPQMLIDGILPVELTSFTAAMQSTSALLEWNTATEVNNYGFDIERNALPEDFGSEPSVSEWEKIGFIIGNGNSNSPKSYRFVDGNPPRGLVMYRLKQIDNDGTASYSHLVTVQNNTPAGFELLQNFPNPFNPSTSIKYTIPQDGYVTLKVYDMLGSEVASVVNETQKAGRHSVNFNAENIPSGTYIYRLQSGDFTETKKLMILK